MEGGGDGCVGFDAEGEVIHWNGAGDWRIEGESRREKKKRGRGCAFCRNSG